VSFIIFVWPLRFLNEEDRGGWSVKAGIFQVSPSHQHVVFPEVERCSGSERIVNMSRKNLLVFMFILASLS
jgi:hypothetical protein